MRKHLGRADSQALLDGRPVPGEEHGDVEAFFAAMRTDYGARPAPAPRPVLASILDGRRPLRTVPEPIDPATERPEAWSRWKRPLRPVAVAFATGTVLFSGLAVADALPAPIQRVTADLGKRVGLDLPRPSDRPAVPGRLEPDVPRSGARDTGGGTTDSSRHPTSSAPGSRGTLLRTPRVDPAIPELPATSLPRPVPVPVPTPVPDGLTPPISRLGSALGLDPEGLLPDLPEVPFAPPSP